MTSTLNPRWLFYIGLKRTCPAFLDNLKHGIYTATRFFKRPFSQLDLRGVGAEIGVSYGAHSKQLLVRNPRITKLYCVDPYLYYAEAPKMEHVESERHAHRLLKKFSNRVRFVKQSSTEAAQWLPKLDFCYIDGDHSYEAVKADIEALWPRIMHGGIIGGHDFWSQFPDVIRAVTEFALANNLKLMVNSPDWWIYKE